MPHDEDPRAHEQVTPPPRHDENVHAHDSVPAGPPQPPPTGLSAEGAKFIARFEGFRGHLYNDAAGHCTIGYGHLVHRGPIDGSESAEFKQGISEARALELLRQDAAGAAASVRDCIKVPLTQPQFDALVSFVFNLGGGTLKGSTLCRLLNERDYASVPAQLLRFTHAGGRELQGLVNRRSAEGALFAHGRYA